MYHIPLSPFLLMTATEVLRKKYILLFVGNKLLSALQVLITGFDFKVPLSKVESYLFLINKNVCFRAPGEEHGA